MKDKQIQWSKTELKVYILLMCAKVDADVASEEIELIKSRIDKESFDRLYKEFCEDDEDICLEKIEAAIENHEYSQRELSELKKEIREIFNSDKKYKIREQNLNRLLDNILY
jgi:hypothetical protein